MGGKGREGAHTQVLLQLIAVTSGLQDNPCVSSTAKEKSPPASPSFQGGGLSRGAKKVIGHRHSHLSPGSSGPRSHRLLHRARWKAMMQVLQYHLDNWAGTQPSDASMEGQKQVPFLYPKALGSRAGGVAHG